VATTTPDDSQEEHTEQETEVSVEVWAEQDNTVSEHRDLFMFTFLGGLAANVGLVVVLALAFLVDRGIAWSFLHGNVWEIFPIGGVFAYLAGRGIVGLFTPPRSRVALCIYVITVLPVAILALGALGYLAGIR
jgi:hypothetical protein